MTDQALLNKLELADDDTKKAAMVLVCRGKVRAFSPHFAMLKSADRYRLSRLVDEAMESKGFVESTTGISAALAMNWCEARGRSYRLTKRGEHYCVEI